MNKTYFYLPHFSIAARNSSHFLAFSFKLMPSSVASIACVIALAQARVPLGWP